MTDADRFPAIACVLPGTEDAQLVTGETIGLVKLSLAEQDACLSADAERFGVPEHWAKFGWTYVRLAGTDVAELRRLLERSWSLITAKKSVAAFRAGSPPA